MVGHFAAVFRRHGVRGVFHRIGRRIFPRKARCWKLCGRLVEHCNGLEIGGPSEIFSSRGLLPLYPLVAQLDNCNFASRTLWEGHVEAGFGFTFDPARPPGWQYVAEAGNLAAVTNARYDCVLSSHTLEHTANPLRVLEEWLRVLKVDGVLVLVLPHMEGTFDHRRPVTSLAHLMADWEAGTTEEDLTHLSEILAFHDLSRDREGGDVAAFTARCHRNAENRSLHHHVFDTSLAVAMIDYVGMQILAVEAMLPLHIIVVARKLGSGEQPQNQAFKRETAMHLCNSPFAADRARPQCLGRTAP